MRSELSENVRSQIVILSKEGYSQRQIVDRLKVSKGAVHGTLKRVAETGSVVSKARSGRPKVTTPSEDRYIELSSLTNRKATSSQIHGALNKARETPISRSTVKRRLCCSRPRGRASRPPIGRGNEARRLEWARKHQHLTADDWKKVLFADEATFEVDGDPTVTHGGGGGGNSVRVWGCFSHSGVGHLHRVDRALTEESYRFLLQRHAVPSGLCLCGEGFTLLRGDSKLCADYLKTREEQGLLTLVNLPPRSPDLNPTRHLWEHLRAERDKHYVTSQEALWCVVKSCWDDVEREVLQRLVESMPFRVHAVVKAKGGRTKYHI